MRYLLLIIAVGSFVGQVFGGEKDKNKIEIFAKVNSAAIRLRYVNKSDIERCNRFNMKAVLNSPCFTCCDYRGIPNPKETIRYLEILKDFDFSTGFSECSREDVENAQHALQNDKKSATKYNIFTDLSADCSNRAIPWSCFVNKKDPSRFKEPGDELFSFVRNIEGEDITFVVFLDTFFGDRNPQDDIDEFRKVALCSIADEKELLGKKILMQDKKGKLIHGPNGYFRNEIKEEEHRKNKILCWIIAPIALLGVIHISMPIFVILYTLYQKSRATA